MTDAVPPKRIFPTSKVDAHAASHVPSTPQTESAAYKLAFQDSDFLLREDLRPVRFQLELLKPELLLDEAKIASTFVFYGSARIPEPAMAEALIAPAATDGQRLLGRRPVDHGGGESRRARRGRGIDRAQHRAAARAAAQSLCDADPELPVPLF